MSFLHGFPGFIAVSVAERTLTKIGSAAAVCLGLLDSESQNTASDQRHPPPVVMPIISSDGNTGAADGMAAIAGNKS